MGSNRNLGVLTSLWRMKRSLLPLLNMSPFHASAPTLGEENIKKKHKRRLEKICNHSKARIERRKWDRDHLNNMSFYRALWPDKTLTRLAAATSQIWGIFHFQSNTSRNPIGQKPWGVVLKEEAKITCTYPLWVPTATKLPLSAQETEVTVSLSLVRSHSRVTWVTKSSSFLILCFHQC